MDKKRRTKVGRTTSKSKSIIELAIPYQAEITALQFKLASIIAKSKPDVVVESEVCGFLGYRDKQK